MTSTKLFVDTSWFKAYIDENDDFFPQASTQKDKLSEDKSKLITSNFVLDESFTLIRVKTDLDTALKFKNKLINMADILTIVRVTQVDEKNAWKWFPEKWSKLSFTDCTSFAVMERLGLKDVLTFDQHFSKAGFEIFK